MMSKSSSLVGSPAAKLGAYAVILGVALAGGALVGATVGPQPSTDAGSDMAGHDEMAPVADPLPAGLAVSRDGYTLDLQRAVVDAGAPAELRFVIEGPTAGPSPTTASSTTRSFTS